MRAAQPPRVRGFFFFSVFFFFWLFGRDASHSCRALGCVAAEMCEYRSTTATSAFSLSPSPPPRYLSALSSSHIMSYWLIPLPISINTRRYTLITVNDRIHNQHHCFSQSTSSILLFSSSLPFATMQKEYNFNAEERFPGPPKNLPERALDYDTKKDDRLLNCRPTSRVSRRRPPSHESPFVVLEMPKPSSVADTVDPLPCPARHA